MDVDGAGGLVGGARLRSSASGLMNGLSTVDFLLRMRRLNVTLSADGDALHCSAPTGVITADLHDELALRKAEILSFIKSTSLATRQQPPAIARIPRDAGVAAFLRAEPFVVARLSGTWHRHV